MSKIRQDSLAFRVLVVLRTEPNRRANGLDLIRLLRESEHLTNSKLINRCALAIIKNLVHVDGAEWKLTSGGACLVDSMSLAPFPQNETPLQKAAQRTIHNSMESKKPYSMADIYKNVRTDGLSFLAEPSLMGVVRKLPSGEVVE